MIKNGRGWQVLPRQQPARAIEVGEDRIEQLCSLHQARLEPGPLLIVDDERQRIEPPRLRGSQVCRCRRGWPTMPVRLVGNGDRRRWARCVRDVVVLQQPRHLVLSLQQIGVGELVEDGK